MLVIGSVIVSRDGYRIGRGNGYVDLDFAILVHAGIVTPKTIIVTTVHDCQVIVLLTWRIVVLSKLEWLWPTKNCV